MKYIGKAFISLLILVVVSFPLWLKGADSSTATSNGRQPSGATAPLGDNNQDVDDAAIFVSDPVVPSLSTAVSDLSPYEQEYVLDREVNPRLNLTGNVDDSIEVVGRIDPLLALQASAPPASVLPFITPILNINGQGYTGVNPPDTVGDVGPNHYIQIVNSGGGGVMRIYNKSLTTLATVAIDSLGSGACASGFGDGIVLYDRLVDRWMVSEFAGSGNHLCVYVSQTPDPLGAWYNYDFTTPNFPDYPKYAVWSDAYYVSSNENSPAVYALDRGQMLSGASASFVRFTAPDLSGFGFQALTPSDLDGPTAPPAGSPNYFMRHRDTEVHGAGSCSVSPGQDCLEIWAFDVDWGTPSNSTFTQLAQINVTDFDSSLCGLVSFSCIQQQGSSTRLDPLREVIMWRLQYRNFGSYETLVGNLATDVDGTDHAGVRWFELRKSGAGSWSLHQEGTYAPDAHSRWMGSAAMDISGNIAVGYNVSSSSMHPSLRYAGRLASDPLGTLPQGEAVMINGSSPNSSNRYGDYSSLSVDPADDCTFWFTGEYNSSTTWSTRITTFRFDSCGGTGPTPTPTNTAVPPTATSTGVPPTATSTGVPPTVTSTPTSPPGGTVFFDDFESNLGWTVNPNGTDTATTGQWQRANPEQTTYNGTTFQLGTTVSGNNDLVTGAAAGSSVGANDIDGGVTSIRSPNIALPGSGDITLSFAYYLSHYNNSSTADFLRVTVVGSSSSLVLEELGAANVDGAVWDTHTASLNAFAGQTIYLLIQAADASGGSLVEAAIDDVRITGSGGPVPTATSTPTAVPPTNTPTATAVPPTNTPTATPPPGGCVVYDSTNVPINLPNGTSSISSNLSVSGSGTINDLNIDVDMDHAWVGDLSMVLTHQNTGTSVTIFDRPGVPASTWGCSGDDILVTLDDEAALPVENQCAAGSPTINGTFSPNNALSGFDGESGNGTWVLTITDHYTSADAGALNAWSIEICTP